MSETDADDAQAVTQTENDAGPAVALREGRDAAWTQSGAPEVSRGQLRLSFLGAWSVVVVGALVMLAGPLGLVAWVAGHWLHPLLVILLCGVLALPLLLGVLVWWLAVTVTLGIKCPVCGDVLVEAAEEDATPGPDGRGRCENCFAPVIEADAAVSG